MEIERKFLVKQLPAKARRGGVVIAQGYLAIASDGTEVRIRRVGRRHEFALKQGRGLQRREIEASLSSVQFRELWPATKGRRIEKRRITFKEGRHKIEVSIYQKRLRGLVVAEIEFGSVREARAFQPPAWFGPDVTRRRAFKNQSLAMRSAPPGV
jgi:adenylate cyclase